MPSVGSTLRTPLILLISVLGRALQAGLLESSEKLHLTATPAPHRQNLQACAADPAEV